MQDKRDIENVVQEIMVLVDALSVECVSFGIGHVACSEEDRAILGEDVKKARALLESKLRELVENSFSVREPLSDDVIKMIDDSTHFHESTDWPIRFARNIERAHGITDTEKDDE